MSLRERLSKTSRNQVGSTHMSNLKGRSKKVTQLKIVEAKAKDPVLQAVLEYRELRSKISFLTTEQRKSKAFLEEAAAEAPEGQIITPEYQVVLELHEGRESFDLEMALSVLGEEALKPFMKTGKPYTRLNVK